MQQNQGMTLLEIIIVVALMAIIYSVGMPQLNLRTGVEISTKLGQLTTDIRSAADMALLTKKSYRLVFMLKSGKYWLESTEKKHFYLGDELVNKDPTKEEEDSELEDREYFFKKYEEVAESEYTDPDTGDKIPPVSPVLTAKEDLFPPKWVRVENLEWSQRDLGSYFIITEATSNRFSSPINTSTASDDDRFFIYFLDNGYIDNAILHIAMRDEPDKRDESSYTVRVKPYEGIAEAVAGYVESFDEESESESL